MKLWKWAQFMRYKLMQPFGEGTWVVSIKCKKHTQNHSTPGNLSYKCIWASTQSYISKMFHAELLMPAQNYKKTWIYLVRLLHFPTALIIRSSSLYYTEFCSPALLLLGSGVPSLGPQKASLIKVMSLIFAWVWPVYFVGSTGQSWDRVSRNTF